MFTWYMSIIEFSNSYSTFYHMRSAQRRTQTLELINLELLSSLRRYNVRLIVRSTGHKSATQEKRNTVFGSSHPKINQR